MIDNGLAYSIVTPLGTIAINTNFQSDGYFFHGPIDVDKGAESDVSARGFNDGSVIGRTRLPGLRYGLSVLVVAPADDDREDLENDLRGYISSMRAADGEVSWVPKGYLTDTRFIRNVRALSVPRPSERIGVYKKFEFEIASARPYVEGEEVITNSGVLTGGGSGLVFSSMLPWFFGGSSGGSITCPNPGSTDELPKFRITGPIVNPRLVKVDTQEMIIFDSLTVAAGDYIEVDMFFKTALLNGTSTVRNYIRPVDSSFFSIPPGGTEVQLVGTSVDANTQLRSYTRGAYAA